MSTADRAGYDARMHARIRDLEAEVERLRATLNRIHRGDPQPWKIAADALTAQRDPS